MAKGRVNTEVNSKDGFTKSYLIAHKGTEDYSCQRAKTFLEDTGLLFFMPTTHLVN